MWCTEQNGSVAKPSSRNGVAKPGSQAGPLCNGTAILSHFLQRVEESSLFFKIGVEIMEINQEISRRIRSEIFHYAFVRL